MGRSVETIGDNVVYFDIEFNDACDAEMEWYDQVELLTENLQSKYPSLESCDKWVSYPYRENRIFLESKMIQMSISEYCGCGAVSVFVNRQNPYDLQESFLQNWLDRVWPNMYNVICESVGAPIKRIGTFSNGCGVFEKI